MFLDVSEFTVYAEPGPTDRSCVLGWLPGRREWIDRLQRARALMGGYAVRDAIREGRATYVPIRLSAIPNYLAALPQPFTAVVVVEIDVDGPRVPAPRVPGDIVATHEGTSTRVVPDWPAPDDVDRATAAHVVRALPPSPTLQYGPLLDAAVRAVDRPVGISSGLGRTPLSSSRATVGCATPR